MDRRAFLARSGLGLLGTFAPRIAFAKAATAKRFVFIIQRGAADGLHILAPTGDPAFLKQRGVMADTLLGGEVLGESFFTLHPSLKRVGLLAKQKQARFVHASASA